MKTCAEALYIAGLARPIYIRTMRFEVLYTVRCGVNMTTLNYIVPVKRTWKQWQYACGYRSCFIVFVYWNVASRDTKL